MDANPSCLGVLRGASVFEGIQDEEDFAVLVKSLRPRHLKAGEILFRTGDPVDSLHVVLEGRFSVQIADQGGREIVIQDIGPGQVVGEMACIDRAPSSTTVVARSTSLVAELDEASLDLLQVRAPEVAVGVVQGLIQEVTRGLRRTDNFIRRVLIRLSGPARDLPHHDRVRIGIPERLRALPSTLQIPSFRGLSAEDVGQLAELGNLLGHPSGSVLCEEGEPGESSFLLLAGTIDVLRATASGYRLLNRIEPGASVGQLALVDPARRTATLRARTDTIVLEIQREPYLWLVASASPLALRFQEHIAVAGIRQLRTANRRLADLVGGSFSYAHPETFAAMLMDDEGPDLGTPKAELALLQTQALRDSGVEKT